MSVMIRTGLFLTLMVIGLSAFAGTWYGVESDPGIEAVPVSQVMTDPESWLDKSVMVSGRITEVCTHRGCWAVLEADGHMLRVQTLDHAFAMPSDARSMARAHGVLERIEPEDEHADGEFRYRLDARGVYIE